MGDRFKSFEDFLSEPQDFFCCVFFMWSLDSFELLEVEVLIGFEN